MNLQIPAGQPANHLSDSWNIPFIFLALNSYVTESEKTVKLQIPIFVLGPLSPQERDAAPRRPSNPGAHTSGVKGVSNLGQMGHTGFC